MAIPPWILESPLKAGIGTMEAGGRLGLAARDTDLREAAQVDAAREAEDRMGLSMQEMQQRREQAAAQLAQSLRAQTALEQYRQSEIANQHALRQQAQNTAAATALHQGQQQQNWQQDFGLRSQEANRKAEGQTASDALKSQIADSSAGFFKELTPDTNPADLLAKYPLASHDPAVRNLLTQFAITSRSNTRLDAKTDPLDIIDYRTAKQNLARVQKAIDVEKARSTSLFGLMGGARSSVLEGLLNEQKDYQDQLDSLKQPKDESAPTESALTRFKWNPKTNNFE